MFSWLVDSPLVRESSHNGGQGGGEIGEKVQLQPGDIVWIGKQPDKPEVRPFVHSCYLHLKPLFKGGSTALGRQRLRLAELAQSRGELAIAYRYLSESRRAAV